MKYFLPLLLAVLVCSCTARADGGAPVYDISGSLTIPGTTPETINFNFDLAYTLSSFGTYNASVVPGTAILSQSGPLGAPFTIGSATLTFASNYVEFFDPSGDEIDLLFSGVGGSTPGPPATIGADLYSCTSAACDMNFCPPAFGCVAGQQSIALLIQGTVEDSAKQVPEPRTFAMLFASLATLLLVAKRNTIARALRLPRAVARNFAA
jgi:hypothetical protein